jgi:hypothetical protein
MVNKSFTLPELTAVYTPRSTGFSLVLASRFTHLSPSELLLTDLKLAVNPDFTFVSLQKNQTLEFKQKIEKYWSYPELWELKIDADGVYQRIAKINTEPNWVAIAKENISFDKLYHISPIINNIRYLPFVKTINLAFSVALEQANTTSDIDLILQTSSIFGLPTVVVGRFWIKLYLKLIGRDTHPFFLHNLRELCKFFGWTAIVKKITIKINYLRFQKTTCIDLGLILDSKIDLEKYITPDINHLGLMYYGQFVFEQDLDNFDSKCSSIYLNPFKYKSNWFWLVLGKLLTIISIIIYPIFYTQALWYWLTNRRNPNQYVSPSIWHSFTKIGFNTDRMVRISNKSIYLKHR